MAKDKYETEHEAIIEAGGHRIRAYEAKLKATIEVDGKIMFSEPIGRKKFFGYELYEYNYKKLIEMEGYEILVVFKTRYRPKIKILQVSEK